MSQFNLKKLPFFAFLIITFFGCAKVDPVTGEKIIIEPNPTKRAEAYRDQGGGLFGDLSKIGQNNFCPSSFNGC
jgi:hypothetical protein